MLIWKEDASATQWNRRQEFSEYLWRRCLGFLTIRGKRFPAFGCEEVVSSLCVAKVLLSLRIDARRIIESHEYASYNVWM